MAGKILNAKLSGTDTVIKITDNHDNPVRKFFTLICPGCSIVAKLEDDRTIEGFVAAMCSTRGQTGHSSLVLQMNDGKTRILNWRLGFIDPIETKIVKIMREGSKRLPVEAPFVPLGAIDGGAVETYEDGMEMVISYLNSVPVKSIKIQTPNY